MSAEEAAAEPVSPRYPREATKLEPDDERAIRGLLKKGAKALDTITEVLESFEPGPERPVKNALKKLAEELEALQPPEPRKCKEYKRALAMAKKGEMGIHPDDVMRFCRCGECATLREKAGVAHPPAPRGP